jgi:hypothetical protein
MVHQGECKKYYFLHGRIAHRQTKGVGVPTFRNHAYSGVADRTSSAAETSSSNTLDAERQFS